MASAGGTVSAVRRRGFFCCLAAGAVLVLTAAGGSLAADAGGAALLTEGPERRDGMAFWPEYRKLAVWRAQYEIPVFGTHQIMDVYFAPDPLPWGDLPEAARREDVNGAVWLSVEVRGREIWFPEGDGSRGDGSRGEGDGGLVFVRRQPRVMAGTVFCRWAERVRGRLEYFQTLPSARHPAPFAARVKD